MSTMPPVDTNDRESLIRWLVWADPNGCYTDEEAVDDWGRLTRWRRSRRAIAA